MCDQQRKGDNDGICCLSFCHFSVIFLYQTISINVQVRWVKFGMYKALRVRLSVNTPKAGWNGCLQDCQYGYIPHVYKDFSHLQFHVWNKTYIKYSKNGSYINIACVILYIILVIGTELPPPLPHLQLLKGKHKKIRH